MQSFFTISHLRVMVQWHLLLLLATVISQCGATEYYVRPTEPTNTSCPGQPCLTLNQYINNSSHYIQSNVVFTFLPGKHVIENMLHIRNVENVTLKRISYESGENPQLIAQFSCLSNYQCFDEVSRIKYLVNDFPLEDCSIIQLINASHVDIIGIQLTLNTVNVSAVRVEQSAKIHLQIDIYSVKAGLDINGCNIGIMAYETNDLYVNKLHASNLLYGLILQHTQNAQIKDSMFEHSGLLVMKSDAVHITSTTSFGNKETGMVYRFCYNIDLVNVSAVNNNGSGVVLRSCRNMSVTNVHTTNNQENGVLLNLCNDISIANISATTNGVDGLHLDSCSGTRITNASITNNVLDGMALFSCNNTSIMNISTTKNQGDGMYVDSCRDTDITDASVSSNLWNGMYFFSCMNTSITNLSVHQNSGSGLYQESCRNTNITNISVTNNQEHGIVLFICSASVIITSTYSAKNQKFGIYLVSCYDTSITNVSAIENLHGGMGMFSCVNTSIMNTSVTNNQENGMYMESCIETNVANVSAKKNQWSGIGLFLCINTSIMNVPATNNYHHGIALESCNDTSIANVSGTNNLWNGMFLSSCDVISITNVSATSNQWEGMVLHSCTNTNITNISVANNQEHGIVLFTCNASITSAYSAKNQKFGIYLVSCYDTSITNVSAIENLHGGMGMFSCVNTSIMNTSVTNNQENGMYMESCIETNVANVSAKKNQWSGIGLFLCINTSIMNVPATNNYHHGIALESCNDASIANVSGTNNLRDGMFLSSCDVISITNVSATSNQWEGMLLHSCTNTNITNVYATKNKEGGIHLLLCRNTMVAHAYAAQNHDGGIVVGNHSFNIAMRNVSLNNNEYAGISLLSQSQLQLEDSVFSDVVPLSSTTGLQTVPAIIEVIDSTLIVRNCKFTKNRITSIRAVGSNIRVQGDVIFANNQALVGTALHFSQSSVLGISETSSVTFENNFAVNYGGAVYIDTEEIYGQSISIQNTSTFSFMPLVTTSTRCFIQVKGNRSQARLTFVNNTAGRGGDVVYGGLVALGYDGDWNCLQSFKNVSDLTQQKKLSLISSAPSHVCLCQNDHFEYPDDCLTVADPHTHNVYPGETITLPTVVVGQDFGSITGSVIAQFLPQPYTTCNIYLEQGQQSISVNKSVCANLKYSFHTRAENCTAILVLKTENAKVLRPMTIEDNYKVNQSWNLINENPNYHELALYLLSQDHAADPSRNLSEVSLHTIKNFLKFTSDTAINCNITKCVVSKSSRFVFPKEIYGYPTFINISFRSCPLGFSISTNPPFKCDCNHLLQLMPQVKCDIQEQRITRDGLVWIGTYSSGTLAASKYCPYNYCKSNEIHLTLLKPDSDKHSNCSNTDTQCNYRHSGILCGGCQPGLSLALGSDRCLHCSNVYISLLLPFAMAGVVLVFLIKFLNLTISQGTMNALIFYANVVSANKYLYYNSTSINPTTLFIAWFNLDIGIETCFFNGLTAYIRTWLQFVFPLYIWTIAGLIIVLAKYNDRVAKVMGNNGVPVLATLFLLSYAKLFNTIIKVLSFTTLQTAQDQQLVWSVDGNIVYLGPEHAPLFAVAVTVLVFLWLPYTLLLLLGQWLHTLNCHLITRLLFKLKPFLDAHYAPFKDRHHYWFGLLLLARVATLLTSAFIRENTAGIIEFSTAVLCMVLAFWGQNVYQGSFMGKFATSFFLNLAIINLTVLFSNSNVSVASFTLIAIALAQFVGLVLCKIFVIFRHSYKGRMRCFCPRKAEDDWELYEQAALLREVESDSEEDGESDTSGSVNSLPTY